VGGCGSGSGGGVVDRDHWIVYVGNHSEYQYPQIEWTRRPNCVDSDQIEMILCPSSLWLWSSTRITNQTIESSVSKARLFVDFAWYYRVDV
jgi:hypothetical protein